ncbi:MAG: hypothetical protein EOO74_11525, partial [Myxococcales bacterium]
MKQTITADHQRWLAAQLPVWQGQGWIDAATAEQIEGSYQVVSGKRLNLARHDLVAAFDLLSRGGVDPALPLPDRQ